MQSIEDLTTYSNHPQFMQILTAIKDKARFALQDTQGRVNRAVTIIVSGGVTHDEEGWHVDSQSRDGIIYHPNPACTCEDATFNVANGFCQHRLAVALYRRTIEALANMLPPDEPDPVLPAETVSPQHVLDPAIRPEWLTLVHGKTFIRYVGLLALAHERGLKALKATLVSCTDTLAVASAEAVFKGGRSFTEYADATPENVHFGVRPHFPRVALTRAKARALRDALNIGLVALEELGDIGDVKADPTRD
jgi:hypothetical protein